MLFPPHMVIIIFSVGEFDDVLDSNQSSYNSKSDVGSKINISYKDVMSTSLASNGSMPEGECGKLLVIKNLTLLTPRSRNILITDLSLELNDGDHLLVSDFLLFKDLHMLMSGLKAIFQ